MAVPLALGPYDLSWKLIPAGIHLAIYALLTAWAGRAQGRAGLLMAAGLMMAAPGFYRALSLTGWGNHAESSLFTLGAIWLLWPRGSPPRLQATLRGLLAGAVCGAGFWFCHTSLHAVPALLLLSLVQLRGWGLAGLLIGAPLGLLPLRESLGDRPEVMDATERWWLRWDAAPPDALADWLFLNPLLRGGGSDHSFALWDPALYPLAGWIGALWWWPWLWLQPVSSPCAAAASLEGGTLGARWLLLGLLSAYALRHDPGPSCRTCRTILH